MSGMGEAKLLDYADYFTHGVIHVIITRVYLY